MEDNSIAKYNILWLYFYVWHKTNLSVQSQGFYTIYCHVNYLPFMWKKNPAHSQLFVATAGSNDWAYCFAWVVCPVNRINHASWVAVVTPTDRPMSFCNRYICRSFGGVFVLSLCFLELSVGVRDFIIEMSQIFSSFSQCFCLSSTLTFAIILNTPYLECILH